MAQGGKIDKSHGFMKEINNQIDRGRYKDEREKTLQIKKKLHDSYLSNNENEAQDQEAPDIEISIEIAPGSFFTIAVSKDRNTLDLANEIADKSGLSEEFIPALDFLLQQKMK